MRPPINPQPLSVSSWQVPLLLLGRRAAARLLPDVADAVQEDDRHGACCLGQRPCRIPCGEHLQAFVARENGQCELHRLPAACMLQAGCLAPEVKYDGALSPPENTINVRQSQPMRHTLSGAEMPPPWAYVIIVRFAAGRQGTQRVVCQACLGTHVSDLRAAGCGSDDLFHFCFDGFPVFPGARPVCVSLSLSRSPALSLSRVPVHAIFCAPVTRSTTKLDAQRRS